MSKAPQRISKDTEHKLIGFTEKIAALVRDGSSPNDAIIKTAQDNDVTPHQVQLLVQAFNNTGANNQRMSSDDLIDKIASFKMADPKAIFNTLYPQNVKEASVKKSFDDVSYDYSQPPTFEKQSYQQEFEKRASTAVEAIGTAAGLTTAAFGAKYLYDKYKGKKKEEPKPDDFQTKKAWTLLKQLDNEYEEKRRQLNDTHLKLANTFDDLVYYFKKSEHLPYKEVLWNSNSLFGKEAQILLKHVAEELPRLDKEASRPHFEPVKLDRQPYNLIESCLEKAAQYNQLDEELTNFSKEAGEASYKMISTFLPEKPIQYKKGSILKDIPVMKDFSKQANPIAIGIGQAIGDNALSGIMNSGFGEGIKEQVLPKENEELKNKALETVMDPSHQQKLRQIRSQAVFHDLMANDEYLSGEHPDKVSKMYNEITRMSPRMSDQPLAMRALLRQYLAQGQVAPHDVDQLAGIEDKLKKKDVPINTPQLPQD